jgi:hypothetical protein
MRMPRERYPYLQFSRKPTQPAIGYAAKKRDRWEGQQAIGGRGTAGSGRHILRPFSSIGLHFFLGPVFFCSAFTGPVFGEAVPAVFVFAAAFFTGGASVFVFACSAYRAITIFSALSQFSTYRPGIMPLRS